MLRAEAADERASLVRERLEWGEDPWDFMDDLPTVDELVVLLIRADHILLDGGVKPTKQRHDAVLLGIARDHPSLEPAVRRLMGEANTSRRWDAVVRAPGDDARAHAAHGGSRRRTSGEHDA